MPDCPNCNEELALGLSGGICPKCLTVYTPLAVSRMPGYNPVIVDKGLDLLVMAIVAGKVNGGIFQADLVNDEVVFSLVERLD
jgi:hypothetical protein